MDIRIVKKEEKTIEVEVVGENETLLNLLKQRLLANPDVESASYLIGHPLLDQPHLILLVRKGKPEVVLRNAAKEIREEFDRMETEFLKSARA